MSDYLTRLVERSLGVGEVVRPRLGSLFEPRGAAASAPLGEESLKVTAGGAEPAPVRPPEPVVEGKTPAPERPQEPDHDAERTLQQTVTSSKRDAPPPPEPPRDEPAPEVEIRREIQPQTGVASVQGELPASPAPQPEAKLERTLQQSVTRPGGEARGRRERVVVHESRAESRHVPRPHESWLEPPPDPKQPLAPPTADEPPVVRVTIGRVDVRAVLAPTPSERAAQRRRPNMTLDEYLRDGGPR